MKVIKVEAIQERIKELMTQRLDFQNQANTIMADFNGQIKALERLLKTPEELAAEAAKEQASSGAEEE